MNLSPVIVKNKTAAHVKVAFALFLERISIKYESFECFLPGARHYQNPIVDQGNSFIFNIQPKLTKFGFDPQRRELYRHIIPVLKIIATFDWLNG